MNRSAFFALSSLWVLCRLAVADLILPSEVIEKLYSTCGGVTSNYATPSAVDQGNAFHRLSLYCTQRGPNSSKWRREISSVIDNYVSRQRKLGRPFAFIHDELTLTLEHYVDGTLTADGLQEHFSRAQTDRERMVHQVNLQGEFVLQTLIAKQVPQLSPLLEKFYSTGLKLRVADESETLVIRLLPWAVNLFRRFPLTWPEQIHTLRDQAAAQRAILNSHRSYYLPQPQDRANFGTLPKGLYFPSHLNHPALPEMVVHEMAHAVQDTYWDLSLLLQHYVYDLKPRLEKSRPALEKLAGRYSASRMQFLKSTAYARHRKQLFDSRDGSQMREWDWVIFIELCRIVQEIDSHSVEGILASAFHRPRVHDKMPHKLAYVLATHFRDLDRDILASISEFTAQEFTDIVISLNAMPRPQT